MPASYASHLQAAVEAAKSAGQLIREAFGKTHSSQTKSNTRDLVTEVDLKSQEIIIDTLKRDFPDIPVVAEESKQHIYNQEVLWLVDPLDGTTNFAIT